MALFKKKAIDDEVIAENGAPVDDASLDEQEQIQKNIDEVMKKYDRESNVRVWEGTPKKIIRIIIALFSVAFGSHYLQHFLNRLD